MKRLSVVKRVFYKTIFLFLGSTLALEASTKAEWERKAAEELSETIDIKEQQSLCALLREYVSKADQTVSENAYNCYEKIQNGMSELTVGELAELLPELLTYAQTKAPRVDSPEITSPSAIAGDTCDLTEVLRLLGIIRSRIGNVFQDPSALTVLGTLGNPLELGPGLNIVRKLLRIQEEFRETWTILGEINSTLTACCASLEQDFQETWTILADITNTLTICCETLEQDFQETWTILADISNTLTACCDDIQGTFTALEACCNSTFTQLNALNILITNDFNQTWTILADISNTLTACCDDIQGTFTALEAYCNSTFTQLNALNILITNNFNQTWTILADIDATLTECCAVLEQDFQETWTILANLSTTLTTCCANTQGTFTALEACCNSTFTQLNALNILITNDFNQTWTILNEINATLTECCQILQQDFQETWTILANLTITATTDLSGIFTVLADTCDTAITITGPMIITQPGTYCLVNDITGSITIAADNVVLNINNKTISGSGNSIEITAQRDIEIYNGFLQNDVGLFVTTSTHITLDRINFVNNTGAVNVSNSATFIANNCYVNNCNSGTVGAIAFSFLASSDITIKNSNFKSNIIDEIIRLQGCQTIELDGLSFENNSNGSGGSAQIDILLSQDALIKNCFISSCTSSQNLVGMSLNLGVQGIRVDSCNMMNCSAAFVLTGIRITGGVIENCFVAYNVGGALSGISSDNGTVNNCVVSNNSSIGVTVGIEVFSNPSFISNNIVEFNIGAIANSNGIVSPSPTNSVFVANQSRGHEAGGTNNYVNVPTGLITLLDPVTGVYTPVTGPKVNDNISITIRFSIELPYFSGHT